MPRSGLGYSAQFEAREAARFVLLTWPAFCALDGDEQSEAIAHYRVHHQMDAVLNKIEADKLNRHSKGKS